MSNRKYYYLKMVLPENQIDQTDLLLTKFNYFLNISENPKVIGGLKDGIETDEFLKGKFYEGLTDGYTRRKDTMSNFSEDANYLEGRILGLTWRIKDIEETKRGILGWMPVEKK